MWEQALAGNWPDSCCLVLVTLTLSRGAKHQVIPCRFECQYLRDPQEPVFL